MAGGWPPSAMPFPRHALRRRVSPPPYWYVCRPTPTPAWPSGPALGCCPSPLPRLHPGLTPQCPVPQAYSDRRLAERQASSAGADGGVDGRQRKGVPHVLVYDHTAASGLGRDKFLAGWVS